MKFGIAEVAIIALIIVFLFGGKKIPELFKGVGEAIKEFRKSTSGDDKK